MHDESADPRSGDRDDPFNEFDRSELDRSESGSADADAPQGYAGGPDDGPAGGSGALRGFFVVRQSGSQSEAGPFGSGQFGGFQRVWSTASAGPGGSRPGTFRRLLALLALILLIVPVLVLFVLLAVVGLVVGLIASIVGAILRPFRFSGGMSPVTGMDREGRENVRVIDRR